MTKTEGRYRYRGYTIGEGGYPSGHSQWLIFRPDDADYVDPLCPVDTLREARKDIDEDIRHHVDQKWDDPKAASI